MPFSFPCPSIGHLPHYLFKGELPVVDVLKKESQEPK